MRFESISSRNSGAAKVYNRHLDCYGERTPLAAAAESGFEDSVALLPLSAFWAFSAGAGFEELWQVLMVKLGGSF